MEGTAKDLHTLKQDDPTDVAATHQDASKRNPRGAVGPWLAAFGAFLVYTASWGFLSAYGSYEKYYETTLLKSTPSTSIAWVGTLQGVVLILGGAVTGPIFDRGYIRELLIVGTIITVLGVMMLSLATKYYQILLSQGICVGIGSAMLYVPSISLVAMSFDEHRALAVFIASSGTAVGGILYPVVFTTLLGKLSFGWITRILGFIMLAFLVVAVALILPNANVKKPTKARALLDTGAFRDPVFMVFCLALFLMWIAYWVPFFLLPTFAQFKAGTSSSLAFYVLVICNAASIPGRYLSVILSNKFGPARSMAGLSFASAILLFGWTGVKSTAATIVWGVLIALFMTPLAVVYPIIIPHLCPNKEVVGNRMGISSAAAAMGTLVGFPLTTALNDIEAGVFWKSQVANGCFMLSGSLLMLYVVRKCKAI